MNENTFGKCSSYTICIHGCLFFFGALWNVSSLLFVKTFFSFSFIRKSSFHWKNTRSRRWIWRKKQKRNLKFQFIHTKFLWIVSHTLLTVNFLYKRSSLFCVICDLGKSFNLNATTTKSATVLFELFSFSIEIQCDFVNCNRFIDDDSDSIFKWRIFRISKRKL